MNLAELRQKAKKAKDVLAESAAVTEIELTEPVNPLTRPVRNPVDVPSALFHPVTGGEEEKPFDPLAILLAGREAASLHEEDREETVTVDETMREKFEEFLCFRVSSEMYAINIMGIKEIIKPREVTEVPRAPSFIAGVLSLRGIIIPLLDMRLRQIGRASCRERG